MWDIYKLGVVIICDYITLWWPKYVAVEAIILQSQTNIVLGRNTKLQMSVCMTET